MSRITAKQLADEFIKYLNDGWGYVYGGQGEYYTPELAEKWRKANRAVPSLRYSKRTYFTRDCAKWFYHNVADCSGGIVYAIRRYDPQYKDRTANTFKREFTVSGKLNTIPDTPGIAVWYSGHIGIYIGNSQVIEFRGTDYGCVKTSLNSRPWKLWGMLKGVDYGSSSDDTEVCEVNLPMLRNGSRGNEVKSLQILLNGYGFKSGSADGIIGKKTVAAIKKFQTKNGLTPDGIIGEKTWNQLLKG